MTDNELFALLKKYLTLAEQNGDVYRANWTAMADVVARVLAGRGA